MFIIVSIIGGIGGFFHWGLKTGGKVLVDLLLGDSIKPGKVAVTGNLFYLQIADKGTLCWLVSSYIMILIGHTSQRMCGS